MAKGDDGVESKDECLVLEVGFQKLTSKWQSPSVVAVRGGGVSAYTPKVLLFNLLLILFVDYYSGGSVHHIANQFQAILSRNLRRSVR